VHFSGQAAEQETIWTLSREFGFRVLEDASHGIGAARNGEPLGSCRWSDICVFSFHPVKIVTSGEGGMAMTNDDDLARRMQMFRSHGITRDHDRWVAAAEDEGEWYYEQQLLGYNYRLTDVQAALGTSQLDRIDAFIERRNELAARYSRVLAECAWLQLPTLLPENRSAFHLYVVRVQPDAPVSRRGLYRRLRERGIGVNVHYMPVHLQPYYRQLGFGPGQFPNAEAYGATAITLPLFAAMTDAEQDSVVAALVASQ
jgi:dTDP-4-amino-4,6-dideoxygalactose transaminase